MKVLFDLILLAVGFLSFLPVVYLVKTPKDMKYNCLKYLMYTTFTWSILIFIERLSENTSIIYYAHMLGYPLKFLLASFLLCTVYNYIEKVFPKKIYLILGFIFIIEFALAITNNQFNFFLALKIENVESYKSLYLADNGSLFIFHLIASYLLVLIAVVYLVVFLSKNKQVRHYQLVTRTLVYSSFVVLLFNLLQLVTTNITVDLTYISLVIVTYALYQVIYHKDMIFNLKTSGRGEILSNMREMYIITDRTRNVVEMSGLLNEKYNIDIESFIGKNVELLFNELKTKFVISKAYDIETQNDLNKDHYHIREKKFTLKGINDYGFMILLYDETQVFKLLRELNQLSNYDNMTGLHNRNYIENYLQSLKKEDNYSVVSLDLNGLKANNDYLGHERGDYLLKELANNIKAVMVDYKNKEMARIGGDEFIVVLIDEDEKTLNKIKDDIIKLCDSDSIIDKISVSIGTAVKVTNEDSVYVLIKKADENMYKMKEKTSKQYSQEIVKYVTNKDDYIR